MRFHRFEAYRPYEVTPRKLSAALLQPRKRVGKFRAGHLGPVDDPQLRLVRACQRIAEHDRAIRNLL